MKRINDLGLIILISLGVICVIYWIKQVPVPTQDAGRDTENCIRMLESDSAGAPGSASEKEAGREQIRKTCAARND